MPGSASVAVVELQAAHAGALLEKLQQQELQESLENGGLVNSLPFLADAKTPELAAEPRFLPWKVPKSQGSCSRNASRSTPGLRFTWQKKKKMGSSPVQVHAECERENFKQACST